MVNVGWVVTKPGFAIPVTLSTMTQVHVIRITCFYEDYVQKNWTKIGIKNESLQDRNRNQPYNE